MISFVTKLIIFIKKRRRLDHFEPSFLYFPRLPQPEDDSVPAFWILPLDVLVWAADSAASAFVAAFISDVHPDFFPFIHFCWAENRTNFIWAVIQTYISIHDGEM